MKKKISLIFISVVAVLWVGFRFLEALTLLPWDPATDKADLHFIAHEGGGIENHTYTNSKEALEQSINFGFKLIEFDLIETSDGKLVAAHDWQQYRTITGEQIPTDKPMMTSEFLRKKIYGRWTPLTSDDIKQYFLTNQDLYLVTDKSNNFKLIKDSFPFHDRLFVEIFGIPNYISAILNGIQRPMYSIGSIRLGETFEYLKISLLGIRYIAVNWLTVKKHPDLFKNLAADNVKIFIYTSNDPEFIHTARERYNATVYTDFWNFTTDTIRK